MADQARQLSEEQDDDTEESDSYGDESSQSEQSASSSSSSQDISQSSDSSLSNPLTNSEGHGNESAFSEEKKPVDESDIADHQSSSSQGCDEADEIESAHEPLQIVDGWQDSRDLNQVCNRVKRNAGNNLNDKVINLAPERHAYSQDFQDFNCYSQKIADNDYFGGLDDDANGDEDL